MADTLLISMSCGGTSDWCLPTLLLIVAVGHILVALYSTVYKRKSALVLQNSSCLQFGSVGSVERYRFMFSLYEQLVNWINLLNVLIICQANFKQYWIVKLDGGALCLCSLLGKLLTLWMTFYEWILSWHFSMTVFCFAL